MKDNKKFESSIHIATWMLCNSNLGSPWSIIIAGYVCVS